LVAARATKATPARIVEMLTIGDRVVLFHRHR